jgi:Gas vesicle synthesis protein GvpL/GvpF
MTAQAQDTQTVVYVYGILPGDVEIESGAAGVGDPPGEVRAVRHRDLAALVSDIQPDQPLGRPEDLIVHEELLDATAAEVPVLPLRFGAVVASDDAVAEELLGAHYDEFSAALRQLEGHAEYVVKGRYVEEAILREVLNGDPQAAQLASQVKDADPDATRQLRMQLGEIISNVVEAKRQQDTRTAGDALTGLAAASAVRPPTHELDAVYTALLVETSAAQDLEQAVQQLADDWDGRVELRLIGPMAAYDFVGVANPAAEG